MSDADELLKFKELLDEGILTQEEFNKKKDEILGNVSSNNTTQKANTLNHIEPTNINNDNDEEVPKKSKNIAWWIFFVLFALSTFGSLISYNDVKATITTAIIYGLMCLMCFPPFFAWLRRKNIKIPTSIRITSIVVLLLCSGLTAVKFSDLYKTGSNSTTISKTEKIVFVAGTNGKNYFQNILCSDTQCEYKTPITLKADTLMPYDTITYATGNDKYSFRVITNRKNEIANIQLLYFDYYDEDPTDYFMEAVKLDYPTKNIATLTSFISENLRNDQKIKIGDFIFHIFKGASDNNIILDIYTEEFAKMNGNL